MFYLAVGVKRGGNIRRAAQHPVAAKMGVEFVVNRKAVEKRQNDGVWPDGGRNIRDRRLQILSFTAKQDQIVVRAQIVSDHSVNRRVKIAQAAFHT